MFRALQLGDLICAVPALRALRHGLPDARIALIGLPWAKAFVRRFAHLLDDFLEFPGFPGLPEQPVRPARLPPFLHAVQRRHFDLAVQLHGSGSFVNPLITLFAAGETAGFFEQGDYRPEGGCFIPYPARGSEIRRLLELVHALGMPSQGEQLEFPIRPNDEREIRRDARVRGLVQRSYACLHPGARAMQRRWPPECFAAVADALAARGCTVVLTGSAEERPITAAVARAMRAPVVDLAGPVSVGALAALIRDARLIVCNDTGVSHIAAALRVPSVVVMPNSDVERWAPLDSARHRVLYDPAASVVDPAGAASSAARACSGGIEPVAVIGEVDHLLRGGYADAA